MKNSVRKFKKFIASLLIGCMAFMTIPFVSYAEGEDITVDGDLSDWNGIGGTSIGEVVEGQGGIADFKIAYSSDGSTIYICYTGPTMNEWNVDYLWYGLRFDNQYIAAGQGGSVVTSNTAVGTEPGNYVVEMAIPVSSLQNPEFTLVVDARNGSGTFSYDSISRIGGSNDDGDEPEDPDNPEDPENPEEPAPEEPLPEDPAGSPSGNEPEAPLDSPSDNTPVPAPEPEAPVYAGIVLDGVFDDWAAVNKADVSGQLNGNGYNPLQKIATVFDGDYFYIYIQETNTGSASNAGAYCNGTYAVTSDLGRNLMFQLRRDGGINGDPNINAVYSNGQWEIAIPKSTLPNYENTVSFGLYQADPVIKDVANLQGGAGNADKFSTIVYDGNYGDWSGYPHSLVQYATAGTSAGIHDGELAIYVEDTTLYGHAITGLNHHTSQHGKEMMHNITIRVNEEEYFYPRLIAVDENGNINWHPQDNGLAPGKYEYYIVSIDAWGTSSNINSLCPADTIYGKITIDVGGEGSVDEAEYYINMERLASRLNLDVNELKYIEAKFGEIGNEYVGTAGTSSGAVLGVMLCLVAVAVPVGVKKLRTKSLKQTEV